jgi:hypothetical protein
MAIADPAAQSMTVGVSGASNPGVTDCKAVQDDIDRADERAERRFQIQVQRNLTRNFTAHLVHGMLGQTGFRLLNAPTFLPAYLMLLSGGSNFAVGLATSLQAFGMMVTPFFGANLIEHRKKVLPVGFSTGWGMRAMVLAIALSGFLSPQWALPCVMVFLAGFGLFQGMQGVIFNFLMAKVIPTSKRGRLTGMRNFLAGIISAFVAWLSGQYLVGDPPTAEGYSYTFLLSFDRARGNPRTGTANGAAEGNIARSNASGSGAASR